MINPASLPPIEIGKKLFEIQLRKEYQTDSGKPTWLCRLVSGATKYENCALKTCEVTQVVGDTIAELTSRTQEVWVLIARTNAGTLKGKCAWIDEKWQLVD